MARDQKTLAVPLASSRHLAPAPQRTGDAVRIGDILEELGVIGAADALLGRYEQDFGDSRRLGEILIAQGVATRDQVSHALAIQLTRRPNATAATDAVHSLHAGRRTLNVCSIGLFLTAVAGVVAIARITDSRSSWYGIAAIGWLSVKLAGSAFYKPHRTDPPPDVRIASIVAFYNEDPRAFLRCLESILHQTHPPDEIWVIDDGSTDTLCARVARAVLADAPGVRFVTHPENRGKRHAQSHAFLHTTCDIVVTIDSDTVLDRCAIAEGLRPFADPEVHGVTGNVRALNHNTNLLTRLVDLRYANAFLFERAAYSTVGSVVCCCGSLSFFRTAVARDNLLDFINQTFLGVPVQYGDDRRLTQYALQRGKVVLQDTAIAHTLVPERLGHFRRQQVRWNKSFFRESLWAIRRFGPRRWPFWISLIELGVWLTFTASLISAVYLRPLLTNAPFPWTFAAFAVVLAYARNVRYLGRAGITPATQLVTFALAPLYVALHAVLLTPMRIWALLTLRSSHWGTRTRVEVKA